MGSELSSEELDYLREVPPTEERFDLVCPDCGAPLKLKVGKFGRFYGCSEWANTRCSGSHGATITGAPVGIPANKKTRALRKRAVEAIKLKIEQLERLEQLNPGSSGDFPDFAFPTVPISCWDEAQCLQVLQHLGGASRWDLLSFDEDFLELGVP
jgi:ssDNA-binding Zn-finger/Zn-ribbon topoisomerase 1